MMKEFKALWKGRLASCLTIVAVALLVSASSALAAETFDSEAAEEEGYWYSRYNMGTLAMRSGLGETFMPDMKMMTQILIQCKKEWVMEMGIIQCLPLILLCCR